MSSVAKLNSKTSDPLRREHVLEVVGRGTDLHSHTVHVPMERPRRHKKSVVRLYSTAVYNRQYVINMRGHRKRRLLRSVRALADAAAHRPLNDNDIIGYRLVAFVFMFHSNSIF